MRASSANTMLMVYDINTCHGQENSDFSKILIISSDLNFFYTLRNLLTCLERAVFAKKKKKVLFYLKFIHSDSCDFVLHFTYIYIYSFSDYCIQPDNDKIRNDRNMQLTGYLEHAVFAKKNVILYLKFIYNRFLIVVILY